MTIRLISALLLPLISGLGYAQYQPQLGAVQPPANPGYSTYPPPPGVAPSPVMNTPKFTVPVISATPIYQAEIHERRVCDQSAPTHETSAAGTILGGLAGGIIGNQVGKGKGKTVATAAGAVGGALVGNNIANSGKNEPVCRMVAEQQQVIVAYDVVYDFSGQRGQVRMNQQPGPTMVVEVRPIN
jgi:uncharacterized protein YcfJ